MAKRKREIQVKFRVDENEYDIIHARAALVGTTNIAAYLRKMALYGYDLLAAYRRQKKNTTFSRTIANALVVLTQIRKHPGVTTEILSEILELSPRTIQRYIESLRIAGEWITYNPSKKGWELQDGKSILFGDFDN